MTDDTNLSDCHTRRSNLYDEIDIKTKSNWHSRSTRRLVSGVLAFLLAITMWVLVMVNALIWSNCVIARPTSAREKLREELISLLENEEQLPELVNQQTQKCGIFDYTSCTGHCILGFETDPEGCVVSCQCKASRLFDGDIILTADVAEMYFGGGNRGASRHLQRWNNIPIGNKFRIPYVFRFGPGLADFKESIMNDVFKHFEKHTCLKFNKRTNENDYLEFGDGLGCSSNVGRIGGRQTITLSNDCFSLDGYIIHEIMHALGFFHEHSRPDRDQYVEIHLENVDPRYEVNFERMTKLEVNSMGSPYDYNSIMHYGGRTYSKNEKPTIIDRRTDQPVVEQRKNFSREDVNQINMMYNCKRYMHGSDLLSY